MTDNQQRRQWVVWFIRLVCLSYIAGLTYLLLTPDLSHLRASEWSWFRPIVPAVHFISLFVLALLVLASHWHFSWVVTVTLLVLYAIGTECLQPLSRTRKFEIQDLVQNLGGVALACIVWMLIVQLTRLRRDNRDSPTAEQLYSLVQGNSPRLDSEYAPHATDKEP